MTVEICVEDLAQALAAERGGANRVELCSGLSEGGLTPGYGLVSVVAAQCSLPVYAMIRPRGRGFVYSEMELAAMHQDVAAHGRAGAAGVVFGCLDPAGNIDLKAVKELTHRAKDAGLGVTFHRAIDLCRNPFEALDILSDLGVDQVLTSGRAHRAVDGIPQLKEMVLRAGSRIAVMAGSGVNPDNAPSIAAAGVQALHCTARYAADAADPFGFGAQWLPDEAKVKGVVKAARRS